MKKIFFAVVLVLAMCFSVSAQSDGFFNDGGGNDGSRDVTPTTPSGHVGKLTGSQPAYEGPLGSGLLILTALGAGYALTKKRK
ncbi:MAG: hypothetical protein IKS65_09150 [Bacteroidales bacterium]|nr:hypothetical protein [Bacteroidales bacterium]